MGRWSCTHKSTSVSFCDAHPVTSLWASARHAQKLQLLTCRTTNRHVYKQEGVLGQLDVDYLKALISHRPVEYEIACQPSRSKARCGAQTRALEL